MDVSEPGIVYCAVDDEVTLFNLDREYRHAFKIISNQMSISIFKKLVPTRKQHDVSLTPRLRIVSVNPFHPKYFDAHFIDPFFVQFGDEAVQVDTITANTDNVLFDDPYVLK